MIYLYSGTPGSGKSLHAAKDIIFKLRKNQAVIANFDINLDIVTRSFFGFKRKIGQFIYRDNSFLTVDYLIDYACKYHSRGKEGQTLLVIDECAVLFNSRSWGEKGRQSWVKFFQMHRHYGYNIILISQNDRLIDRQIRAFIEYDVKHRKLNNFRTLGLIFSILRQHIFVAITFWYGVHEKCNTEFFMFKPIYKKLYDSYSAFGTA